MVDESFFELSLMLFFSANIIGLNNRVSLQESSLSLRKQRFAVDFTESLQLKGLKVPRIMFLCSLFSQPLSNSVRVEIFPYESCGLIVIGSHTQGIEF